MKTARVLVASPIRQKPEILEYFLKGLEGLSCKDLELSFLFVDDNTEKESKKVLQAFAKRVSNAIIQPCNYDSEKVEYRIDETTHYWNDTLVQKVARLKDEMIEYTLQKDYDALFLIDSDVVVHPRTLEQLRSTQKPIISNIFWTSWVPNSPELPQVWLQDKYTLYHQAPHEQLGDAEIHRRIMEFLNQLRRPGVYEVGGLGACTWIERSALEKGVNFSRIHNISLWGEDRHFCVRAVALGIPLYVDTHYPAYHIYRPSMLGGAEEYLARVHKKQKIDP